MDAFGLDSEEGKPLWPRVEAIDSTGLKRCYVSESSEHWISRSMEAAAAFNIEKLIDRKINPKHEQVAAEEVERQLSFVEKYCNHPSKRGAMRVTFRRFEIWKSSKA